tara:strand:+ start:2113 stop:2571 length:459 start_codon:yes stop_codon:yes gene_type:complete
MRDDLRDAQRSGTRLGARLGSAVAPVFQALVAAGALALAGVASFWPVLLVLAIIHAIKRVAWHGLMMVTPAGMRRASGEATAEQMRREFGLLAEDEVGDRLRQLDLRIDALVATMNAHPDGDQLLADSAALAAKYGADDYIPPAPPPGDLDD